MSDPNMVGIHHIECNYDTGYKDWHCKLWAQKEDNLEEIFHSPHIDDVILESETKFVRFNRNSFVAEFKKLMVCEKEVGHFPILRCRAEKTVGEWLE